ncbi:hypothetical protein E2C01_049726 [Portunus trituberculatus]|uniref:Uncharacterized protein n=1 Tax=Portunus trituberculatus TaxID=210409 RepID=A0A5B7GEM7_PORTR|nr:hypothetical protein [Portunus trituberculatus]
MTFVPHTTKLPSSIPVVAGTMLTAIIINEGEVRAALSALEENKGVGHDVQADLPGTHQATCQNSSREAGLSPEDGRPPGQQGKAAAVRS